MANERGVLFGNYHSYDNWGLHMVKFPEISPPTVQSLLVEVPGRDGKLNLSKALDGNVHYTSRKCSLVFDCTEDMSDWPRIYSEIMNYLHGQEVQFILDSDPGYYYQGVLQVVLPKYGKASAEMEITGDCDPYKYEIYSSENLNWYWDSLSFENGYIREYAGIELTGTDTIIIIGNSKPVTPKIDIKNIYSSKITVTLGSFSYDMTEAIPYTPAGLILKAGTNKLQFTGCGTISIIFTGGSL